MAKYRVTIEVTAQLSREIEANSADDAEQLAENMYHEYQKGDHPHVIGTEQHRSVELLSNAEPRRWGPVGT